MRLRSGDKFDRYTIEETLGEGGMGVVYRALDPKLERKVALKVLRSEKVAAEGEDTRGRAVARMLREARAAAALSHPNAVSIYDVGEHDGTPYLAMELIEGTSLRRLVGADVPIATRLRWLGDIGKALSAAHKAGLVHRDVKPENVIRRDDGVLKVLDFGIARSLRLRPAPDAGLPKDQVSTLTAPGSLSGTPAYMAPEQIRGDPVDGRADQFSWGVLAYELLSGKVPFGEGRDPVGVLACVLTDKEPRLDAVAEIPEAVADVVHRALSKAPADRFASMSELLEALADASEGAVEAELGPSSTSSPGSSRAHVTPAKKTSGPRISSTGGSGATIAGASPQRRSAWPFVAILAGISAVSLGALFVSTRQAPTSSPGASAPSAASGPAIVPTAITDLPPPKTQSPEALAAFREGLQGFRDAGWLVAHDAFTRAVKLDPTFAAAYLRLAMTSRFLGSPAETREAFQKAMQHRASLSERDQVLLDALEPRLFRDPSDAREASRRAEAAFARYPGDAELAALVTGLDFSQAPALDMERADRCLALDPLYADCWQAKGMALRRMKRFNEAIEAFERCLGVSAVAHDCLRDRALSHAATGQCEKFEADAKLMVARVPGSPDGYDLMSQAFYAEGRPLPTVQGAMRQARSRTPEAIRELFELRDEARLAVLAGRLDEAEALTRKRAEKIEREASESINNSAAPMLVQILEEAGKVKEAGAEAAATLARLGAWTKPVEGQIVLDPTMVFLAASRRAELLSAEEYEAKRAAWLREAPKLYPASAPGTDWFVAYAAVASTPEEAKAALERMPDPRVVAPFVPVLMGWNPVMGRLYWLAGRHDEALPFLRDATKECVALTMPFQNTRAHYHLGDALAATGDKEGACQALQVVMDRWGAAKTSVTAKAAAARRKALACGE